MSFLRRVLGGGARETGRSPVDAGAALTEAAPAGSAEGEDDERDRELVREDDERLSDVLLARQLRYADRKWTPPAQGGARRADDAGAGDGERG